MSGDTGDYYYGGADGLRLYCRVYPAGKPGGVPVLCLPGLTRNSRDFESLADHLAQEREVLAADLRGRGRSAWDQDSSRYNLGVYVADAWRLLESRGIIRVLVVGTSLGGLMGMVMAASSPDRIAGVVLNDVGPELDLVGVRRIAGYAGKLPAVASWTDAAAQARSVYGSSLPGLTDAEWLAFAQRSYRENSVGVPVPDMDPRIADAFKTPSAAPADVWPLFRQLKTVPVLAIRGALSDLLSAATLEQMAREKPDLERITVPNRGHTPLLNEPECLAAIDSFVARHGPETPDAARSG
jgi:pimeloyl-ACP methyl ester carboxylesterase